MTPTITPYREQAEKLAALAAKLRESRVTVADLEARVRAAYERVADTEAEILTILHGIGEAEVVVGDVLIRRAFDDGGEAFIAVSEPLVLT